MTNEEAISVIENEIQIDVRLCTDEQADRFQTALYMAISALRAETTGDPLTIEQLREMDGKPVWVKVIGKTGIRCDGWCEVEIRDKDPFAYVWWPGSEVEDIAKIEDYGKTWACYAYPPAYIDREAWTAEWKEYTGADAGFHYCSKCGQQAFNYEDGREVVEVLSDFCPSCARAMTPGALAELEKRKWVMGVETSHENGHK